MQIKKADKKDIKDIVRLYKQVFRGIISGEMPESYLTRLFTGFLTGPDTILLCARQKNRFAGFIAGSINSHYLTPGLKLELLWRTMLRTLFKGTFIPETFRILKKQYFYKKLKITAELVAIAIEPGFQRQGLGEKLVNALEKFYTRKKIKSYHVFTDRKISKGYDFYKALKFTETAETGFWGYRGTFFQKKL